MKDAQVTPYTKAQAELKVLKEAVKYARKTVQQKQLKKRIEALEGVEPRVYFPSIEELNANHPRRDKLSILHPMYLKFKKEILSSNLQEL